MARKTKAPKGKRYPLNMRTTLELRQKIDDAAKLSGRSLVQEVEYRLEQSFLQQNFSALMREHAETTAKLTADAMAEAVAKKVVESLHGESGHSGRGSEAQHRDRRRD